MLRAMILALVFIGCSESKLIGVDSTGPEASDSPSDGPEDSASPPDDPASSDDTAAPCNDADADGVCDEDDQWDRFARDRFRS